jgi:hypothetical protein
MTSCIEDPSRAKDIQKAFNLRWTDKSYGLVDIEDENCIGINRSV